jgi:hypothetical protein
LENLLVLTNASRSTLLVDKVYALQGLLPDVSSDTLVPDYSLAAEQIFTTVAQSLAHDPLDLLSQVAGPFLRQLTNLPTWVPDWSTLFRAKPFLHYKVSRSLFQASGNTTPSVSFSPNRYKLVTKGIVIDKIKTVGLPFLSNKKRKKTSLNDYLHRAINHIIGEWDALLWKDKILFFSHFYKWETIAQNLKSYPTKEVVHSAFARKITIIADANISAKNQGLNPIIR